MAYSVGDYEAIKAFRVLRGWAGRLGVLGGPSGHNVYLTFPLMQWLHEEKKGLAVETALT